MGVIVASNRRRVRGTEREGKRANKTPTPPICFHIPFLHEETREKQTGRVRETDIRRGCHRKDVA